MSIIVSTGFRCKPDTRGRVRFSHDGYRFEVTVNNVRAYIRYRDIIYVGIFGYHNTSSHRHRPVQREERRIKIPVKFLSNNEFLRKLDDARDAFV